MKLGILWYDADQRVSPQARLAEAATRFAERFGRPANCCHVNPEELFADPAISVVADPSVLKHHFWVGRDEALEPERRPRERRALALASPPKAEAAPKRPRPKVAVKGKDAPVRPATRRAATKSRSTTTTAKPG